MVKWQSHVYRWRVARVPVKFGPEGYSSTSVRRFQQHQPPDTEIDLMPGSASGSRRSRMFGIVLLVAIAVAAVTYLGRPIFPSPTLSAVGKIVEKDALPSPGGPSKLTLGISIPLPTGAQQTVVIECDENIWRQFKRGDEAIVHYRLTRGTNEIVVTQIEPKPGIVEL